MGSSRPEKAALKAQLVAILAADLALRERAYKSARDAATHEEAKPENDKDTRALEQSYLARGEARRFDEMRSALAEVTAMIVRDGVESDVVVLGAVVTLEEDGERSLLWLAPHGGGSLLEGGTVRVVTPKSPLGQALLGKRAGDECEVKLGDRQRALAILAVA